MPDSVQQGMLLLSPLTGTKIDYELPGFLKGGMQGIARSPRYQDGEALALAMSAALTVNNKVIGDAKFNYLRPRHLPIFYQASKGHIFEFSVNFDACFVVP